MGSIMGKALNENMKANQDFMLAAQRMQVERQMMMQNALREQQMAIQIAKGRDLFHWWAAFYSVAGLGSIVGFKKSRRPAVLVPLLPLTFIVAYLGDMAYGSKMARIKEEAVSILSNEADLIELPRHLPSIEELDRRRQEHWKTT